MPLYVSAVKGHVQSRFGTATATANNQQIGVSKDPKTDELVWDETLVVLIPDSEAARFPREYQRAFAEGSLTERSKEDYEAWLVAHQAPQKAAAEAAKKAAAEAAKKAAEEAAASKASADAVAPSVEPRGPAAPIDEQPEALLGTPSHG